MQKQKRGILSSLILSMLLLTISLCGCAPVSPGNSDDSFEAYGSYGQDARFVTENIPTKIMVYGEDLYFHPCITTFHIDSLTEENCLPRDDDRYSEYALIINDTAGELPLSDEDYALLDRLLDTGHYSLFYFGRSKIPEFRARNFGPSDDILGGKAALCLSTDEHGARTQLLRLMGEAEVYRPEEFSKGILSELTLLALARFYRDRY